MSKSLTLVIILYYFGCLPANQAPKRTIVIPASFQGKVEIHYGIPQGKKEIKKDDYLIFEIPPNGVLKTQINYEGGYRFPGDQSLWIQGKDGTAKLADWTLHSNFLVDSSNFGYWQFSTTTYWTDDSSRIVEFFYVGSRDFYETFYANRPGARNN